MTKRDITGEGESQNGKARLERAGWEGRVKEEGGNARMGNAGVAGHCLSQAVDAAFFVETRDVVVLVYPCQAAESVVLALCQLKTLHQLADGDILLGREAGRLVLEVVHDELEGTACFVLGRGLGGTDGRDGGRLGHGRGRLHGCFDLWVAAVALDHVRVAPSKVAGLFVHLQRGFQDGHGVRLMITLGILHIHRGVSVDQGRVDGGEREGLAPGSACVAPCRWQAGLTCRGERAVRDQGRGWADHARGGGVERSGAFRVAVLIAASKLGKVFGQLPLHPILALGRRKRRTKFMGRG